MLKHPTLDQLNQLSLTGMAHAFSEMESNGDAAGLSHAEWLAMALDHEATWRNDRPTRVKSRILPADSKFIRLRRCWPVLAKRFDDSLNLS